MNFQEIDPAQSLEEIRARTDLQLLDVREPWEYEKIHLEGVRLIPLGELADRYEELDSGKPVLCICAGGVRSERAARFLVSKGFQEVINMAEGMKGWESRGLPTNPK
jgi:adenylyltransferase/sulfurtransferase